MEMKRQGSDGIYEICIIESFPGAHKTPLGKNFKALRNWQPQNALQWPSTKFQHCGHIKYSWKMSPERYNLMKLKFRCGLVHKHCISSGCFFLYFCPFVWSHLGVDCLFFCFFVLLFVCLFSPWCCDGTQSLRAPLAAVDRKYHGELSWKLITLEIALVSNCKSDQIKIILNIHRLILSWRLPSYFICIKLDSHQIKDNRYCNQISYKVWPCPHVW